MLTHHLENATPADGVTCLDCDPAEAVRIGMAAAGPKNLEVLSPTTGRLLHELGLIDEIGPHIAPILLGAGIRLYDDPGSEPICLLQVVEGDPTLAVTSGTTHHHDGAGPDRRDGRRPEAPSCRPDGTDGRSR